MAGKGPAGDAANTPELEPARKAILRAALAHVPFDGWTEKAIEAGIRDAGRPEALSKLAFPGGPSDMAEYYLASADARMEAALDAEALAAMRVRERIAYAIRLRMTQAAAERAAVAELMAYLALPGHQGLAARCLYRTVDAIWRALGDTSTDFNFYSKRAILAAVLGATVLYWLHDDSEGFADTKAFLDRRIEDVMAFEKAKGRAKELFEKLPDPFRLLREATRPRGAPGPGEGGAGPGATDGRPPAPDGPQGS